MRRLMAVPMSVAMLMIVIQTSAAQSVNTSSSGSPQKSASAGSSSTPAANTGAAGAPALAPTPSTTAAPFGAAGSAAPGSNEAVKEEQVDAGTYGVRLRDLEQRINELKEQIFRSKARLSLLAETVLQGVVAGSQTVIVHENKMSGSYKLVKAVYALDGAPILNRADEE